MRIFIPRETTPGETRVSLLPDAVGELVKAGADMQVEAGLGNPLGIANGDYTNAGATVAEDRAAGFARAEMVLRLHKPPLEEIALLPEGCLHVSFLDPFRSPELVNALNARRISAVSLEMIPRTTLAQKMDVLSSQASLAGYAAVVLAAERLDRIFPMMMTPAGTISPARVFVIGAGVAGLQAIATAKRLGARIDAFDVRPETEDQIKSLGAKFLKVDLGETSGTAQGYAKQLTPEQLARQREAMARQCALSDVVIAAAQVFGRKAPTLVTSEMRAGMKPGAVVVDLAVETGGNVEGSEIDQEISLGGVRILGHSHMARRVPWPASEMLSSNLRNFVRHFWDKESKRFAFRLEDEILNGCLVLHEGDIRNPQVRELAAAAAGERN
jgi:H+-translocating NAD(P) transhydrogenase subunit alpha